MPDTLVSPSQISIVRECTGFLVTWEAAKGYYQHYYADELDEALDAYDNPKSGYQSVGMSACKAGVPYCQLAASVIMAVRGRRRAA